MKNWNSENTKMRDTELLVKERNAENSEGQKLRKPFWMKKDSGIDGILVTVGLCIIALLLCVVMKTSLGDFIETIMGELTEKASLILKDSAGGM